MSLAPSEWIALVPCADDSTVGAFLSALVPSPLVPQTATPAGLTSPLLPFQARCLSWMLHREASAGGGGILADEMGLGKTVEIISLILASPRARAPRPAPTIIDLEAEDESETMLAAPDPRAQASKPAGSLIIVPDSIAEQWQGELRRHAPSLSVVEFSGTSSAQPQTADELAAADVVLARMSVVTAEFHRLTQTESGRALRHAKRYTAARSTLLELHFQRAILDEVQLVPESRQSGKVARKMHASSRWAVSGTPCAGSVDDLTTLLAFAQGESWVAHSGWARAIEQGDTAELLRVLQGLLWRQTKARVAHEMVLPPLKTRPPRVQLSLAEREAHATFVVPTSVAVCEDWSGHAQGELDRLSALLAFPLDHFEPHGHKRGRGAPGAHAPPLESELCSKMAASASGELPNAVDRAKHLVRSVLPGMCEPSFARLLPHVAAVVAIAGGAASEAVRQVFCTVYPAYLRRAIEEGPLAALLDGMLDTTRGLPWGRCSAWLLLGECAASLFPFEDPNPATVAAHAEARTRAVERVKQSRENAWYSKAHYTHACANAGVAADRSADVANVRVRQLLRALTEHEQERSRCEERLADLSRPAPSLANGWHGCPPVALAHGTGRQVLELGLLEPTCPTSAGPNALDLGARTRASVVADAIRLVRMVRLGQPFDELLLACERARSKASRKQLARLAALDEEELVPVSLLPFFASYGFRSGRSHMDASAQELVHLGVSAERAAHFVLHEPGPRAMGAKVGALRAVLNQWLPELPGAHADMAEASEVEPAGSAPLSADIRSAASKLALSLARLDRLRALARLHSRAGAKGLDASRVFQIDAAPKEAKRARRGGAPSLTLAHSAAAVGPTAHFSGKLAQTAELLHSLQPEQAIVFCRLVDHVGRVTAALKATGLKAVALRSTLDGGAALALSSGAAQVLVLHSGTAAAGLTLTSANHAIFFDVLPPAEELQAAARVHRYSQLRETTVWRLACAQSLEIDARARTDALVARLEAGEDIAEQAGPPTTSRDSVALRLDHHELRKILRNRSAGRNDDLGTFRLD